jgi:hypothetical protein
MTWPCTERSPHHNHRISLHVRASPHAEDDDAASALAAATAAAAVGP